MNVLNTMTMGQTPRERLFYPHPHGLLPSNSKPVTIMKPNPSSRRCCGTSLATFSSGPHRATRFGGEGAFTFTELLAVLGSLALLMAVTVPLLAGNRSSSDRAVCQSNLRQIGRAFNMWADDHGGRYPYETPGAEGGVSDHPIANNTWFQFLAIRAELESPRVLVCPTDGDRVQATDWSSSPNGGFSHPTRRNSAISYTIGLGTLHDPRGLLSSDSNINGSGIAASCCAGSAAGGNVYAGAPRLIWDAPELDWTEKRHNRSGNILRFDGSVIAADQDELRRAVYYGSGCSTFSGSLCVLYPN